MIVKLFSRDIVGYLMFWTGCFVCKQVNCYVDLECQIKGLEEREREREKERGWETDRQTDRERERERVKHTHTSLYTYTNNMQYLGEQKQCTGTTAQRKGSERNK